MMKQKGTKDFTFTKRRQLEALLKANLHKRDIAKILGVCLTTVYNELKRGKCTQKVYSYTDYFGERHYKDVQAYSADIAERNYRLNQSAHGAPLKICNDFELVREIEKRVIDNKMSVCAALGEIKRKSICKTNISKTTLYRYVHLGYIFTKITTNDVQIRTRKQKYRKIKRAPKGTSIEQRPKEIDERKTFGHWEMDCVLGKQGTKETLLTLTERLTRYEIILKMPNHKTNTVVKYLNKLEKRYGKYFRKIFKSITVDNGSEFSNYNGLEKSIYGGKRTTLYYCHPYTSCERGSNERLNREIRRLIPKGVDLSTITNKQIANVENWLNAYPREIFNYATSKEKFDEQLNILNVTNV